MRDRCFQFLQHINDGGGLARSSFLYAFNVGNKDWASRSIQWLLQRHYIARPPEQRERELAHCRHRIYALTSSGEQYLKDHGISITKVPGNFWHAVMIS